MTEIAEDCADFLLAELAAAGGAIATKILETKAQAAGLLAPGKPIGESSAFRKAKADLRIRSRRIGGSRGEWVWSKGGVKDANRPKGGGKEGADAIVRRWTESLLALSREQPPNDNIDVEKWSRFVDHSMRFLESRFALDAVSFGWSESDLFNIPVEPGEPAGLLWLLGEYRAAAAAT